MRLYLLRSIVFILCVGWDVGVLTIFWAANAGLDVIFAEK